MPKTATFASVPGCGTSNTAAIQADQASDRVTTIGQVKTGNLPMDISISRDLKK